MAGEGRYKCQVNLPLTFKAIFSWCSSRVLPLIAILLLTLLAVHRLIILPEKNLLDDCYHVYLDMGTNTGVQVVCTCMMLRFNIILNRSENYTSLTCFLKLQFSRYSTGSLDPQLTGKLSTFFF